ncbi:MULTISPECIES: flavodoxin domain-containing protein [unclassified Breznakia]|uniref:flavodoxin domain-containing protein n=1 Tax=unclassified Breznakia TaxID=2623764 RepID=UPI002474C7F6|nr:MULTISPECIES: flavodoxin domain-containing protein [unclassified Breznakia]MDH6366841.1 menaquinone-dependent protoporphyrinogen oxidase [Breznakia sp. PH1-1]MDH6404019.1 menaquinone-dependent protoporphyrinogen oxidase [Breznakia sp. PF1-11]MDH6411759.1 menaquinone-dependent protoporphyrinogen oxidase [Breznakia sp. PFB1-11]MDH6414007.1 menaquinone-dependent protoporphyrinogen oxidase [Breznakia sp. PFB1-14]MDH6416437.1 menaquinone-dependent protoporphyrinogen oxidase [Breznakia sp. PFB1-4
MKTLVLYATKYGSTEEVAKTIADNCDADLVNIEDVDVLNLDRYTTVIFGSPLYVGKLRKDLIRFMRDKIHQLSNKSLHLFVNRGTRTPAIDEIIEKNIPEYQNLLQTTIDFGGTFDFNKMNLMDSLIVRTVNLDLDELDSNQNLDEKVSNFIGKLAHKY